VEVNAAFCELYNCLPQEAIGLPELELVTSEYRELMRQKIAESDGRTYEGLAQRTDGSSFWADFCSRPGTYRGKSVHITAVRDAGARKLAEEKRIEQLVSRERSEFLKDFLNTISHDLKTPLAVINTSVYLLEKEPTGPHSKNNLRRIF